MADLKLSHLSAARLQRRGDGPLTCTDKRQAQLMRGNAYFKVINLRRLCGVLPLMFLYQMLDASLI